MEEKIKKRGLTIAEKIFSAHVGRRVHHGEVVIADIDVTMATDGSGPLMLDFFEKMEGKSVANPEANLLVMDHYVPCPNDKVSRLQRMMQDFADKGMAKVLPIGEGICHQLLPEMGYVRPGYLITGGDSHSTSYGAFHAMGMGVGSSDLAAAIISGNLWFRVPDTICIKLYGNLSKGVSAKDLALEIVGQLGASGAVYHAIEFQFEHQEIPLSLEERMTVCNLMAETGAKCAIMPGDGKLKAYYEEKGIDIQPFVEPDNDAEYARVLEIHMDKIEPVVACPHRVDQVVPVREVKGIPVQMGLIGTCTNGRLEDFQTALDIMGEHPIKKGFQLLIVPASRSIYKKMAENGMLARFVEKGAVILPPSCGPCCGSSPGTPGDGVNVISTANRNFIGRMGNVKSGIYLAAPACVAASAVTGMITDPREVAE